MAQWHLREIEQELHRVGWTVVERLEPNAKECFVGGWIIKRQSERQVDFDGIFDGLGNVILNPSLEKAYGCEIVGTSISLYFYKKGRQWDTHLSQFISQVNELS